MTVQSRFTEASNVEPADIQLREVAGNLNELTDDQHDRLLNYLVGRLKDGNSTDRSVRINRYSRIDRLISTWQKLNADDTKREKIEDVTGRNQAIPMNLPLLASHLEDTVSFFAEVFAPQRRDFYVTPDKKMAAAATELAKKMNRDTRARKYYAQVCSLFRSLIKYNVGGLAVRWESGGGQGELSQPGNRVESIDMYNYLWDPSVIDADRIHSDAEWTARITTKNRLWLERKALRGELQRVDKLFDENRQGRRANQYAPRKSGGNKEALFYRNPPNYVGLAMDGQDMQTGGPDQGSVNWDAYGAALSNDSRTEIKGFETVEMYCWLNPAQFGLEPVPQGGQASDDSLGLDKRGQGYSLWRFVIIDSCEVCLASKVESVGDSEVEIPHYLSFLTQDEMREAQRSIMELLRPFQRFASFLMNIYVAGARKNIWGLKVIDPSMLDSSGIEKGDVAGWLKSKQPGRDVRTGFSTSDSNTGVQESMQMLSSTLELVRVLFPSQALPSQIAGIDRAVKNQVSAVLQGAHRRMHMLCRLVDSSLFGPMRLQCYRNLAQGDAEGLSGLNEEEVAKVLGSGLMALNAESVAAELNELLFAILQNPESTQRFNLPELLNYWSQVKNLPISLGDFIREEPAAPQNPEGAQNPEGGPPPQQ